MELVKNLLFFLQKSWFPYNSKYFHKRAGFHVIVNISIKKIAHIQILLYSNNLAQNKALPTTFIPRYFPNRHLHVQS